MQKVGNEMNKIATHNSATGEKSKGLISRLVYPFSRCQRKTIREQYEAGCRYFDIRVKLKGKHWVCAHGLWTAKKLALTVLREINSFEESCYVMLTYEGKDNNLFMPFVQMIEYDMHNIKLTSVNVKKPKWHNVTNFNVVPCNSEFKCLDGSSWHTYLPLPWLWKKIYYNKPKFNDQFFKMVDFL